MERSPAEVICSLDVFKGSGADVRYQREEVGSEGGGCCGDVEMERVVFLWVEGLAAWTTEERLIGG